MKTDLSVIIVNWNTKELLKQCIDSVQNETKRYSYEIIVADNNSSDGSAEMVLRNFPYVRLIRNLENFGFAAANNHAINIAKGSHILLLNPDTLILDGATDKMMDEYVKKDFKGLLTCRLLNPDLSLQKSVNKFYSFFGSLLENRFFASVFSRKQVAGSNNMNLWDHSSRKEIDWARGAVLMFAREVKDAIGVLDENYYIYGEEIDFYYRAKKAGYKALFIPEAEIIHYGKASSRQRRTEMFFQNYKSFYTFLKKNYPLPSYYIYRARTMMFLVIWSMYYFMKVALKGKPEAGTVSEDSQQLKIYNKTIAWHFSKESKIKYA